MFSRLLEFWRRIAEAHRSDDDTNAGRLAEFLFPRPTRGFFLRMASVALLAGIVFGFILTPCIIDGESMMPTYPKLGFTFCWRGRYLFSAPQRGDVVVVRYAGKTSFLKRVVALEGETVAFHRGVLYRNGIPQKEPYVRYSCAWELPERKVMPGHCYVVGDNRSQYMEEHRFGQVLAERIVGAPLW